MVRSARRPRSGVPEFALASSALAPRPIAPDAHSLAEEVLMSASRRSHGRPPARGAAGNATETTASRAPAPYVDRTAYIAHAVAAVRDHGYVPADASDREPTWQAAGGRLERDADLSAADLRRAHEIVGWAVSLKPRDAERYRARLAGCLARERLTTHELPLAASAVRAFNLHLYYEIRGRKRATPTGSPASGPRATAEVRHGRPAT